MEWEFGVSYQGFGMEEFKEGIFLQKYKTHRSNIRGKNPDLTNLKNQKKKRKIIIIISLFYLAFFLFFKKNLILPLSQGGNMASQTDRKSVNTSTSS